ncbi:MAG: TolB family protein [Bryobacterales bacterium]|nr:TolB family protein [Bryobacterales bacterium]
MLHRFLLWLACMSAACMAQTGFPAGVLESGSDIGVTPRAGSLAYDAASSEYRITGGGANIWGTRDALYFAWKRITGDVVITADVRFLGEGVNPHRKAVLMIRQDLSPGSAYADIALHGDGLTSLQYRAAADGPTQEIKTSAKAPTRVRIERRGNTFTVFTGQPGSELAASGSQTVPLSGAVYAGLGVCSHEEQVLETAVFTNVRIETPPPRYRSKIATFDLTTRQTSIMYEGDGIIEAPNWSRDGSYLLVNTQGNLYRLSMKDGADRKLQKIDLGDSGYRCNNDHDLSPDGKLLAFSASSPSSRQSQVYVANADGSGVRLLTPSAPSYFHGWSPDGKWLAFVGQRNGKYELYRVPAGGGAEERLTSKGAYDDGPDYSPDGKWIYFNSDRSGSWDVWRIPANGGGANDVKAQQVTNDESEDWFPHISPDGKRMIFFSFPKGTKGHNDRMPGVSLRMMPVPGKKIKPAKIEVLTTFFGGQGTINVNSWAPDSKRFAFVIYEPVQ